MVSSLLSANRDESRYACPHAVDTSETPAPHLTFGYGIHQCAGQSLARVELRVVLRELFNAFPKLHSTMPVEQLPYRENMFIYGLLQLPVAW